MAGLTGILNLGLAPALGFISPGFAVAGLALLSIPIIIHLLNRRRYRVLDWAAMQFLLAAMRKNRRRVRFEQWLLLAVRCAVIALAGLALARPLGCDESSLARLAGQSTALHVIVIDNSYSMAYRSERGEAATHLDQAKKLARQIVERMSSGGESVLLVTAGHPARVVIARPNYDIADAARAIDRVEQSFGGTDLPGALQLARQLAAENQGQPTRILHLITDATASAWRQGHETQLETLGSELAASYRVRHYNLAIPNQTNAGILSVEPAGGLVRTRFANEFIAQARSYGGAVESSLLWRIGEESLPAGASMTLDIQTPPVTQGNVQLRSGGPTVLSVQLSTEDRLAVDNIRHRTLDVAAEMKVLLVEGRRGMTPLEGSAAFLDLALAPPTAAGVPGRMTASYIKPERISDIELGSRTLGDYRAIMLSDVGQVSAPVAEQLQRYVQQGGTLVWFMGEQVQRENYNATLVPRGLLPGPLTQRQAGDGVTFSFNPAGNIHPLLQAFANIENSGLSTAQVFTYWQVSLRDEMKADRVLSFARGGGTTQRSTAAMQEGDPAITLHQLGDGRVVFFASTADAEWTSFPAKPAYVALVHEIVAGTVAGRERWMNLEVGERIQVPQSIPLSGTPLLREPDGRTESPLEQVRREDGSSSWQSPVLSRPGVYRVMSGDLNVPISVNVSPREADIRPLGNEAIKAALGNIEMESLGAELPAEVEDSAAGNDLGWAVMLVVLVLLGVECLLAMRFGHYRR